MSNTVKCRPDEFQKMMRKAFKQYGDLIFDVAEEEAKSNARQGASELKRVSPKDTGIYARGWSHKKLKQSIGGYSEVIYNRTSWMISHLVEKPHKAGKTGHYPAKKDNTGIIARVEEEYATKFYRGVFEKVRSVLR